VLRPNAGHGLLSFFRFFLDHTQRRSTVGRTPLDEWSSRRRDLYLTTQSIHNRQTSMPPVGFKPTISAGERPQDVFYTHLKLFRLFWGIKIFYLLFFHLPFFICEQWGWWSVWYFNIYVGRSKSFFFVLFMVEYNTRTFLNNSLYVFQTVVDVCLTGIYIFNYCIRCVLSIKIKPISVLTVTLFIT